MAAAPIPETESARLQVLRQMRLLDTHDEAEFDHIAALAARLCGAATALVSLVDEHRQWFKARHGLLLRESPRDDAFCAHAILHAEVLWVRNNSSRRLANGWASIRRSATCGPVVRRCSRSCRPAYPRLVAHERRRRLLCVRSPSRLLRGVAALEQRGASLSPLRAGRHASQRLSIWCQTHTDFLATSRK